MGEDPDDRETRRGRGSRDLESRLRADDAGSPTPRIDLDQDPEGPVRSRHRGAQRPGPGRGVDADRQLDRLVESPDPIGLRAAGPDRVGDEDVVDTAGGHDLGLTDGPDGDALCPELQLELREVDDLVGLHVGTKGDPAGLQGVRESAGVRLDPAEIEHDRRRIEAVRDQRRVNHPAAARRSA